MKIHITANISEKQQFNKVLNILKLNNLQVEKSPNDSDLIAVATYDSLKSSCKQAIKDLNDFEKVNAGIEFYKANTPDKKIVYEFQTIIKLKESRWLIKKK